MASRDVIVMIKWNHQKISNYLLDEKFTQLYLMKIGPVFFGTRRPSFQNLLVLAY